MALTPERKVKDWIKARLKAELPGGYMYMPPGGAFGRIGTPDLFYLWKGVFIAIEAKSDAPGAKPTALQLAQLQLIKAAGGVAAVIKGRDEGKIQAIVQEARRRSCESAI